MKRIVIRSASGEDQSVFSDGGQGRSLQMRRQPALERKTPTVGLEPTTTRLRALRSTD